MDNVGTVPTYTLHNIEIVPTFEMHNIGAGPTLGGGLRVFYCHNPTTTQHNLNFNTAVWLDLLKRPM